MRMDKNDRYQYLRDRNRCGCCGKQDARTLEGYAHCVPCAEKARIRYNSEKCKEFYKQKRIDNLAKGICTRCGSGKPSEGYRICDRCREYAAYSYRRRCAKNCGSAG